jgi:hypothetical protein
MTPISVLIPIVGGCWVVFLASLFIIVRPRGGTERNAKAAANLGLPLTEKIDPLITDGNRTAFQAAILSCLVSLIVAGLVLSAIRESNLGQIFFGYTLTMYAGFGIGATIAALVNERHRQALSVRFARASAVTANDYRSPLERWTPRVAVAVLVVGVLVRATLSPSGFGGIPILFLVYVALAIASLILTEVATRLILGRNQPAGSPLELAWDDAFKSRTLGTLIAATTLLGGYGALSIIAFRDDDASAGEVSATTIQLLIGVAGLCFVLISNIVTAASRPQLRYLRRLWPDFATENDLRATAQPAVKL